MVNRLVCQIKDLTTTVLSDQFIILIGLMGAGKSSLGHRLAARLPLPFKSDVEVERAAGCTIQEIFDRYGEAEFREGEKKVIKRLFCDKPSVIATGGGSFMNDETRRLIRKRVFPSGPQTLICLIKGRKTACAGRF